jgi:hypothetical protein
VPQDNIAFSRETYTFRCAGPPPALVDAFRRYYGPTMNAFEAAQKDGREEALREELEALFESQNTSPDEGRTAIPATFLRVTVTAP